MSMGRIRKIYRTTDFVIDEENNEIIIYDAASIKLLYYNLETGLFKRENLEFRIEDLRN